MAGRPTRLTKEVLDKTRKYLEECKDETELLLKQRVENEKGVQETHENKLKVMLPSVAGLARYLGTGRSSIYDWQETESEHREAFSDIIEEILAEQETRLVNGGLDNSYNSTIAKLILTKHGYSDKREHTGKDGGPLSIQGVNVKVD